MQADPGRWGEARPFAGKRAGLKLQRMDVLRRRIAALKAGTKATAPRLTDPVLRAAWQQAEPAHREIRDGKHILLSRGASVVYAMARRAGIPGDEFALEDLPAAQVRGLGKFLGVGEAVDEAASLFPPAKAWAVIQANLPELKGLQITRREIRKGLSIRQHNPRAVAIEVAHAGVEDIAGLTAQLAALFQGKGYDTKYPTDSPAGGMVLVALKLAPKAEAAVHYVGKRLTSGEGGTPAAEAAKLKPEDRLTIDGHNVEILSVRSQQRTVTLFPPFHPSDPRAKGLPLSKDAKQQVVTVWAYLLPLSLQQTKFTFYGPKPTYEGVDYTPGAPDTVSEDIVWDRLATHPLTVVMYLTGPDKPRGHEVAAALAKSPDVRATVRDASRGLLDVSFDTSKFGLGWDLRVKEFLTAHLFQRLHAHGIRVQSRRPIMRVPAPTPGKTATEATTSAGVGGFRLGHVGTVARPIPLPFPGLRKRRRQPQQA